MADCDTKQIHSPICDFGLLWSDERGVSADRTFHTLDGVQADESRYQMVLQSSLAVNIGFVNNMGIEGLGAGKGKALDPMHIGVWSGEPDRKLLIWFCPG
jgi:hypothetical protein